MSATIACDGVLLTGCFVPEAALVRGGHLELDPGSGGPAIDQFGRCSDPTWFAAGNVLRPVETAGWSLPRGAADRRLRGGRSGRPAAALGARDRRSPGAGHQAGRAAAALRCRSARAAWTHCSCGSSEAIAGELILAADGKPIWRRRSAALPERRLLVPLRELHDPAWTARIG